MHEFNSRLEKVGSEQLLALDLGTRGTSEEKNGDLRSVLASGIWNEKPQHART